MSAGRQPRGFVFYPQDWRGDAGLHACSLAARGLLIELLGLAHEARPYGHVLLNGSAPTAAQVGLLLGVPEGQVETALAELERYHVLSRTAGGVLFSRRMLRDEQRRVEGRKHGSRAQEGSTPRVTPQGRVGGAKALPRAQASARASPETETETETVYPPKTEDAGLPFGDPAPVPGKAPPSRKKPAEHLQVVEVWQRLWASIRLERPIPDDQPVPVPCPYAMAKKDWVAASQVWEAAGKDLELVRGRSRNLLRSDQRWARDHASLPFLASNWNQLDHRWHENGWKPEED